MKKIIIFALAALTFNTHADFAELDIVVRESLEEFFYQEEKEVDLSRLEYYGEPVVTGNLMDVQTTVWAEQRLVFPYWSWYYCTTKLEIVSRGRYKDLGSTCEVEID